MNIIDKTDEEILAVANPMWDDLIKYSNEGEYGKFIRNFSYDLLIGLNEVEVGKQFAKSELTRKSKSRSKNSNAVQARTTYVRTYDGVKSSQQQREKAITKVTCKTVNIEQNARSQYSANSN